VTITPNRLLPAPTKGVDTFDDAINALLTGKTYIEISSIGFPIPGAEIRGQILP